MTTSYTAKDITVLEGLDPVRPFGPRPHAEPDDQSR